MLLLMVYCSSTGSSRQWPPWGSHSLHMVRMHLVALAMLHMLRVALTTQEHPTLSVLIPARMGGARIVQRKLGGQLLSPTRQGGACQALRMAARSLCAGSGGNSGQASA